MKSLVSLFLKDESSRAANGFALIVASIVVTIIAVVLCLRTLPETSPMWRPKSADRAISDSWNDWLRPTSSGEPQSSPENPTDRPPPERGMISLWFGLGPSTGRHERSIDSMKRGIHDLFRGIHTRKTEVEWRNPKTPTLLESFFC